MKNLFLTLVEILGEILILLMAILLSYIVLYGLNEAIKSNEKIECEEWRKMEIEYTDFYWTDWQREQCKNY